MKRHIELVLLLFLGFAVLCPGPLFAEEEATPEEPQAEPEKPAQPDKPDKRDRDRRPRARSNERQLENLKKQLGLDDEPSEIRERLLAFRDLVRRWQKAALLPIDQLVLTLAQDLFDDPADLAVAHKLAVVLRRASESHPDWQLPELTQELAVVARNERRFLGLSGEDSGFDPDQYKGQVIVATVHKAKGLEWDRVYLMSVNNYSFPSGLPHDRFISEKWFVRDGLNLEAEALAQLQALLSEDLIYEEGAATQDARLEYAAERLRLLYVGITRARKELILTWNTGRRGDQQPAVPFIALQTFWEQRPSS